VVVVVVGAVAMKSEQSSVTPARIGLAPLLVLPIRDLALPPRTSLELRQQSHRRGRVRDRPFLLETRPLRLPLWSRGWAFFWH